MNALPFRLKIGVTGHRSGIPTDGLKETLRAILKLDLEIAGKSMSSQNLLSLCNPSTREAFQKLKDTPLSLCIYTALAEGTDRIIADVVLENETAIMKAILPLVEEDYEEDFLTEDSLGEFRRLLQLDPNPIRLKTKKIIEECLPEELLECRRNAYYAAGKYIVDECDILIAVWDGLPSKGKGGTRDVIEYARSVQRPIIIINCPHVDQVKMEGQLNFPTLMIAEIDHFNRFEAKEEVLKQFVDDLNSEYFDSKKFPEMNGLDKNRRAQLNEYVFKPYAKSSILARGFKQKYMMVGLLIYVFSSLAIALVLLSVIFNVLDVWAFIIEFILLSVIYTSIHFAREGKIHARWLGYRFLAERIRSASYFFLAGFRFEDPLSSKSDEYTSRNDAASLMYDEIWLPVNRLHPAHENLRPSDAVDPVVVEYVRKSYIEEQLRFQERYYKKHHRKNIRLETAGQLLFFFAILAAVLHIVLHFLHSESEAMEWINKGLTFLALIFPTVAAALEGIRHKNEYARNTHRSSVMRKELIKLSGEYGLIKTNEEFSDLLKKSAALILNDNEDWRNLMRERELEIVV